MGFFTISASSGHIQPTSSVTGPFPSSSAEQKVLNVENSINLSVYNRLSDCVKQYPNASQNDLEDEVERLRGEFRQELYTTLDNLKDECKECKALLLAKPDHYASVDLYADLILDELYINGIHITVDIPLPPNNKEWWMQWFKDGKEYIQAQIDSFNKNFLDPTQNQFDVLLKYYNQLVADKEKYPDLLKFIDPAIFGDILGPLQGKLDDLKTNSPVLKQLEQMLQKMDKLMDNFSKDIDPEKCIDEANDLFGKFPDPYTDPLLNDIRGDIKLVFDKFGRMLGDFNRAFSSPELKGFYANFYKDYQNAGKPRSARVNLSFLPAELQR